MKIYTVTLFPCNDSRRWGACVENRVFYTFTRVAIQKDKDREQRRSFEGKKGVTKYPGSFSRWIPESLSFRERMVTGRRNKACRGSWFKRRDIRKAIRLFSQGKGQACSGSASTFLSLAKRGREHSFCMAVSPWISGST